MAESDDLAGRMTSNGKRLTITKVIVKQKHERLKFTLHLYSNFIQLSCFAMITEKASIDMNCGSSSRQSKGQLQK